MNEKKFFDFIRSLPCHFQNVGSELPGFTKGCSQAWNDQLGQPISQVSHILRRNSVRLKGHKHFGNVFPNCGGLRGHHQWFESLPPEIRETYLPIGQMYLSLYREKFDREN